MSTLFGRAVGGVVNPVVHNLDVNDVSSKWLKVACDS